ncbi:MAG: hypothetical protein D6776_04765 [Planctomycetota bacterium]|nr:MAG: hypothetical protein D6776_04765 [Planctomycetota bacterium]
MRSALMTKLAVLAVATALTGCIKSKQYWTIYPDGSGKVEIENTLMGMMAQMAKMGGQMGPDAGEAQDPYQMIKESVKGKVYWSDFEAKDGPNGEYVLKGTAYFENINDVSTGDDEDSKLVWKKNDDGSFSLVMQNDEATEGLPGMPGMGEGGEPSSPEEKAQQEQMKAMMMGMLAGFEVKIAFTGPGEVTDMKGFQTKDGRTVAFTLTEDDVKALMNKEKTPPKQLSATFAAPGEGLAAEFEAFKKALAEAKAKAQKEDAGEGKGGDSDHGKKENDEDSGSENGGSQQF